MNIYLFIYLNMYTSTMFSIMVNWTEDRWSFNIIHSVRRNEIHTALATDTSFR